MPGDVVVPRPTVRGRDTQARLEQAAREVIARKGFFKTTITDITSNRSPFACFTAAMRGWCESSTSVSRVRPRPVRPGMS